MKKFLFVIAIAGIMTSCKDKKDEKKAEDPTTITPTEPTTTTPTTTATSGVPSFSDPEVQKFANEYTAFINEYKTGMVDPAKAQAMSKSAQEWATKMTPIAMKLASNPEEMKKWTDWATALTKDMMPAMKQ